MGECQSVEDIVLIDDKTIFVASLPERENYKQNERITDKSPKWDHIPPYTTPHTNHNTRLMPPPT